MNKSVKKNINSKKNVFSKMGFVLLIIGLIIGFFIGFITTHTFKLNPKKSHQKSQEYSQLREGGYKFINPLLECDNFYPSDTRKNAALKENLFNYVENTLKDGVVKHISVYYRNLNNGPWIGINEHHNYTPASLLKVPVMIAVLKKIETDRTLLTKMIPYKAVFDTSFHQNMGYINKLKIGQSYSVEQLIEYMIVYSDNEASDLLVEEFGNDLITKTVLDMGINLKNKDLANDFISVKEYSSFFRVLYNASYLSKDLSEKALELLSKTQFKDGIPARLPKDLQIANKFGERALSDTNLKQLHDCGIIYLPEAPYLLCIMTKGNDFNKLLDVIADISEIVYNNVSSK